MRESHAINVVERADVLLVSIHVRFPGKSPILQGPRGISGTNAKSQGLYFPVISIGLI
jgi:hypothetical protein